jgi:hypothetical protein
MAEDGFWVPPSEHLLSRPPVFQRAGPTLAPLADDGRGGGNHVALTQ